MGAASFCVAGAALGAPGARFAWQAQHSEHLRLVLRSRRSTWNTFTEVFGSPATSDAFGRHLTLRGSSSTWSSSASFCVAGAALGASQSHFAVQVKHSASQILPSRCRTWRSVSFCKAGAALGAPSTQYHLDYIIRHTIINTTPSPQHHQHNLINTSPSTKIPSDQALSSPSCFYLYEMGFHENQGSFHSDHMFLMVIHNASSRWQICASWMMLFIEILDT